MFMVALTTHWKVGTFRTSKRINLGLSRFQRDSWNVLNHIELLKQELDDLNGSWRVSPIEKTQKNSKQPRHKRVIVTSKNKSNVRMRALSRRQWAETDTMSRKRDVDRARAELERAGVVSPYRQRATAPPGLQEGRRGLPGPAERACRRVLGTP